MIENSRNLKNTDNDNGKSTDGQKTGKGTLGEALARNALDDIPQPKSDAKEIVGLVKSSGRITGYQLSDGSTVSSYARDAVSTLVQLGAVTGDNGRLLPHNPITRAEAAVILHFVMTM